jgi:predicted transcriptional regulator
MKEIDLEKSVYELTEKYPELIEILKELGFLGVANPVVRKTLGKKTSIPQGCKLQGKELNDVIEKLHEKGFSIKQNDKCLRYPYTMS